MRTQTNTRTQVKWNGDFGPSIGDRTVVARYSMEELSGSLMLSVRQGDIHTTLFVHSLPHLLNFYRDLGDFLNELQPGLTLPLPEGDWSEVDAMKVLHEADQLRLG